MYSIGFRVVLAPGPPELLTQPNNLTNAPGSTATFSVTALDSQPLSYQWIKGGVVLANGGNISGATSATLTLANVQRGDAGSYRLLVSNAIGSVTSIVATLTVTDECRLSPPQVLRLALPGFQPVDNASATSSITIAWDPSSAPDIETYTIHYGLMSGRYTSVIDVGNITMDTIVGILAGETYFFAVTVSTIPGCVSGFSNEISYSALGPINLLRRPLR